MNHAKILLISQTMVTYYGHFAYMFNFASKEASSVRLASLASMLTWSRSSLVVAYPASYVDPGPPTTPSLILILSLGGICSS